jgi:hypothetical protein
MIRRTGSSRAWANNWPAMADMPAAPFLKRVSVVPERVPTYEGFPYGLPFVRGLDLPFKRAVTYLVGENGSGKSTLIEAIAEACGLPVSGGGRNEVGDRHGPEQHSALGGALRPRSVGGPKTDTSFGPNTKLTLRRSWISVAKIPTSLVIHTPDTAGAHFMLSLTAKPSLRSS